MNDLVNITLGRGKAVHVARQDGEFMARPECGGKAAEHYRLTTAEVTCKSCLKWLSNEAKAVALAEQDKAEKAVEIETAGPDETSEQAYGIGDRVRYDGPLRSHRVAGTIIAVESFRNTFTYLVRWDDNPSASLYYGRNLRPFNGMPAEPQNLTEAVEHAGMLAVVRNSSATARAVARITRGHGMDTPPQLLIERFGNNVWNGRDDADDRLAIHVTANTLKGCVKAWIRSFADLKSNGAQAADDEPSLPVGSRVMFTSDFGRGSLGMVVARARIGGASRYTVHWGGTDIPSSITYGRNVLVELTSEPVAAPQEPRLHVGDRVAYRSRDLVHGRVVAAPVADGERRYQVLWDGRESATRFLYLFSELVKIHDPSADGPVLAEQVVTLIRKCDADVRRCRTTADAEMVYARAIDEIEQLAQRSWQHHRNAAER